jgi:hypothetical protein
MNTILTNSKIAVYEQLIAGFQKNALNFVFFAAGQRYTAAQIIALLQSLITSEKGVLTTNQSWHDAVAANNLLEKQNAQFVLALRRQLGIMYGNLPATLTDFGIAPKKPPKKPRKVLTLEERALCNQRARATRFARGTYGRKWRVAGDEAVPATSGSEGASTSAPLTSSATAPAGGSTPGGASRS